MAPGPLAVPLIKGAVGLLGGLLGRRKAPTPEKNLLSQAKGARAAAEQYGFNPLTMLQYGQTGGAAGAYGAPLASAGILTDTLNDVLDVTTGDKARRDARVDLENDLLRLQVEQARSGVQAVGPGAPILGTPPANVVASNGFAFGSLAGSDSASSRLPAGVEFGGVTIRPAPGFSDAERIETRYAELGANFAAPFIAASDLGYNAGKAYSRLGMVLETNRRQKLADDPFSKLPRILPPPHVNLDVPVKPVPFGPRWPLAQRLWQGAKTLPMPRLRTY